VQKERRKAEEKNEASPGMMNGIFSSIARNITFCSRDHYGHYLKGDCSMIYGHRFNPEKADLLLDPRRREKLPPEEILALLEIEKGDIIADLGSGNGYFTVPIAEKTGTTVYAVDIEPKMLDSLMDHAAKADVKNIQPVTSDLAQIKLPNHSVDKIFSSMVMHEISSLNAVIGEIKRIVRPNAKLLILDWEAIEMKAGPPLKVRIPSEKLKAIFEAHHFRVEKRMINSGVYAFVMSL